MSSNQQSVTSSSSSSYKSTTVSILQTLSTDDPDDPSCVDPPSSKPDDNNITPATNPHHPQFTNLIEKTLLHDEREITINNSSADYSMINNDPVVVVTSNSSVVTTELTDDDEFECDREINQITNNTSSSVVRGGGSPEPSGNLELAGLRRDTSVVIRVGGTEDVVRDTSGYDDEQDVVDHHHGVEFEEFVVGGVKREDDDDFNTISSSSKSSKSSSKSSSSFSSSKTVQSQSSMEQKMVALSKQEAITEQLIQAVKQANSNISSIDTSASTAAAAVTMVKSEGVAAIGEESTAVKEQGIPAPKKTKVERKSSKAGSGKKNKNASEISKENISVTTLTSGPPPPPLPPPHQHQQQPPTIDPPSIINVSSPQPPRQSYLDDPRSRQSSSSSSTTAATAAAQSLLVIPEDLAKKLGPGESRVFAKVCVANLRRSFGDLTVISSGLPTTDPPPPPPPAPLPPSQFNKFSGSNSLEYNRINSNSNQFKCNLSNSNNSSSRCLSASGGGPSSLPSSFAKQSNMSRSKSSFSKFDSLVAKNASSSNVAAENKESVTSSSAETNGTSTEGSAKTESKKMFCASCEKQVFQMELVRAEKKDWHKNCFRCVSCRKVLGVDTYQSHEQRLYCKPHFKELFQPKAVLDDGQEESDKMSSQKKSSTNKSKLQLIICESQPKELPPDVVRASDAPTTGLEDIQIDVRSKFEMFEGLKEKQAGDKSPEPLVVKRSASVLAKLKKYENSLANGNTELEGVSDDDIHGVDGIELQSEEEEGGDEDGTNFVIKEEIKRKLKNPLQALNEIAHFKQMDQVRSKWEEGSFTRDQMNADSRKEELQKFRSRLCQGKSGQLKELYEKGVDNEGGESLSDARRAEIDELRSERARAFREMFERGEVIRGEEDEEGEEDGVKVRGVDLEVFEAGVAKESKRLFEEMDKKVVCEKEMRAAAGEGSVGKARGRFVRGNGVKLATQGSFGGGGGEGSFPGTPSDIVRCSDKKDEPVQIDTAALSSKFKFFETYEDEMVRKAKEGKRDGFKRITPPREDGVVKTEKDYDNTDSDQTYRDPTVVRHGESQQDDTLQKSRTASKMLSVFRQMEENLSRGDGAKDPIIRPLKQFTPPRDTVGSGSNGRIVDSDDEECEDDEEEEEEQEEDEEDEEEGDGRGREDDFLKEVGSLARARSLRAKFERWEQQENERNRNQGVAVQDELAESIESAKNLKAKFEAMRLMGDAGNKENGKGGSPLPIKVNRFVLNTNNLNSSSSSTSTSPQQLTQFCAFNSLPADVTNHHNNHHHNNHHHLLHQQPSSNLIMSSNEQCALCEKRVYVMEKIEAGGKMYHKNCFRCSQCKCILRMDTFTSNKGTLFCTTHFKQLFKIKGNYDEGFGHETQYQQWQKTKQAQAGQN